MWIARLAPRRPSSLITSSRCRRARTRQDSPMTKKALRATSSAGGERGRAGMGPARSYFGACRRRSREVGHLPDPADRSTREEYLRPAVTLVFPCRDDVVARDREGWTPLVERFLAGVVDADRRAAARGQDVALT